MGVAGHWNLAGDQLKMMKVGRVMPIHPLTLQLTPVCPPGLASKTPSHLRCSGRGSLNTPGLQIWHGSDVIREAMKEFTSWRAVWPLCPGGFTRPAPVELKSVGAAARGWAPLRIRPQVQSLLSLVGVNAPCAISAHCFLASERCCGDSPGG